MIGCDYIWTVGAETEMLTEETEKSVLSSHKIPLPLLKTKCPNMVLDNSLLMHQS